MNIRIRLLTAAVLLRILAPIMGQEISVEPPKTGSVSGVVIDAKSGDGVAKAVIILRPDREQGIGEIAGADGKFTLRDVEPGAYVLDVERDGYVIAPGQSKTVKVQAGQTTSDVKVKLLRTGTISGRILDADGDPISSVNVAVSPTRARKGDLSETGFARTNDRGDYRAYYIAPGEYRVSATHEYARRNDGVLIQRPQKPDAASGGYAYPIVYFPGTLDARRAAVVTVEPGAELRGIDIQLVRVRGVRVRGRVTVPSGGRTEPLFRMVGLIPIGRGDSPAQTHDLLIRDPNGRFEFTDVLPGMYRIHAEAAGVNDTSRMAARQTLEVGDSDLEGIELTPGQPRALTGRVIAPEGHKLPMGLVVALGLREEMDAQAGGMAQVGVDGTFTMPEVEPGEYDVLLASAKGGEDNSYISAMHAGDADVLAEGVRVGAGPMLPIEIVLKANGGSAECEVKDDKGDPIPNANILLAPDAPRQRQVALFGECQTLADGKCKILGITPGEYHAYALPAGTVIDHRDQDALKPFEKYGQPLRFVEGEQKLLSLKAVPIE